MYLSRSVTTIDCNYLYEKFAASYLLIDGSEAAFIDNNTALSVPRLLDALKHKGLSPEQVRYIIITHVHLDHAGGTSTLLAHCKNATVIAHPKAKRHIVDPSKLVASAMAVYGEEQFKKLYGSILPIPEERVKEMSDREELQFGSGKDLGFLHTRGHANHHFCIYEPETQSVFTGDAFGLRYPAISEKFIFPSTSPTDFNFTEAIRSLDTILTTGARCAYLTHFGQVEDLPFARDQLTEDLNFSESLRKLIMNDASSGDHSLEYIESQLTKHMTARMKKLAVTIGPDLWSQLKLDINLNAQGLLWSALKERSTTQP